MASSGDLVSKLATLWALPENAVLYPYRVLRENGAVTKGGRGRSAAKVTPRDAASLMIAVACTARTKEVFETWKTYSDLNAQERRCSTRVDNASFSSDRENATKWKLPGCDVPALIDLPPGHSFVDGLAALIAAFADGTLDAAFAAIQARYNHPTDYRVFVDVWGPLPHAVIKIHTYEFNEAIEYRNPLPIESGEDLHEWASQLESLGGLMDHSNFTAHTLKPIADLIAE